MPFFSAVIPVYNRYDQVKRAVNSVLSQDFNDYEIIVIDDGSTDRTPAVESEYAGRIRYIRRDNAGVASARNTGITASSSPYIAFLDSDDTWHPAKLRMQAEFIRRAPSIKIHQTADIWIRNGKRVNPPARYIKPDGIIFIQSLEQCIISPSSVVISRDIFDEYGLFDEGMPVCEDYDFWLRVTPFESIGLIKEKLITRYSGHDDQLSAAFWGMDRFRVYSILKLLDKCGPGLPAEYKNAAVECAAKKLVILEQGARKNSNAGLSAMAGEILKHLRDGCCTKIDYQSLLGI